MAKVRNTSLHFSQLEVGSIYSQNEELGPLKGDLSLQPQTPLSAWDESLPEPLLLSSLTREEYLALAKLADKFS